MFVWLIGGELTLHFIFKIVRGDFLYFVRVDGLMGYIMSFIWHLMTKVVGDFRSVRAKQNDDAKRAAIHKLILNFVAADASSFEDTTMSVLPPSHPA